MDDVVLLYTDKNQMQQMLNTTHDIASRYRIKFQTEKSKCLVIVSKEKTEFKIGDLPFEKSNTYKYLGNTINNRETMHDHINAVKGKCEATTQSILSISNHKYLREQDMATIMQLHDVCTVLTLLYESEAWIPTKDETTIIEAINNNILKRFLRTPKTTAKELIFMETALTPISAMMDRRQIIYHAKKSKPNYDAINQKKDPWDKRVRSAMRNTR